MIPLLKMKTVDERVQLQLALYRLKDISTLVLNGAEPLLANRLGMLVREVDMALNNSLEYK